jgi:hypothetical protein
MRVFKTILAQFLAMGVKMHDKDFIEIVLNALLRKFLNILFNQCLE